MMQDNCTTVQPPWFNVPLKFCYYTFGQWGAVLWKLRVNRWLGLSSLTCRPVLLGIEQERWIPVEQFSSVTVMNSNTNLTTTRRPPSPRCFNISNFLHILNLILPFTWCSRLSGVESRDYRLYS
ncbi:hypothetical protein XENOCAPTIV_021117 [Xenoophorus captivus]|uniref:Uncharacterized protein n=1 Tax=Xenoophorus captivus TaxID=1517983 RepID=A0ABV0R1F6_9TELE